MPAFSAYIYIYQIRIYKSFQNSKENFTMLTKTKTKNPLEVMQIATAQEKKEKWNDKEVRGEKEFI